MMIGVGAVFFHFSKDLPDYTELANYDPDTVTRLYSSDSKLLAEYATEKRVYVPLKYIPKLVSQAFIAAEDKNFYSNNGIDIYGIARAVKQNFQNLIGTGHTMAGGSTITQQVVKNFLLSNEKTLSRKVKEAILAYRITQVYSKDRILELYLNEIYLGKGSYGVAAAALNYFNKSLDELNIEEAAFLAAMPQAPARIDPILH
ncbi:MAG: transglycosylase domain-containing protein, partial [Pseudomonadota bacterium]